MSMLTKLWRIASTEGFGVAARKARRRLEIHRDAINYRKWVREYDTLTEKDRTEILAKIEAFPEKPLISVLMPVYNVDEVWLRKAIESVRKQLYPHWELCIADDNSTRPHVRRVLEEYAARHEQIKVAFRDVNGHISAASNSALELVIGEFTVLLDHDDELSDNALFRVVETINSQADVHLIYSDEDHMDTRGRRYDPHFKPDWSEDLFYSLNLVTHLSAYRTSILRNIGGFRVGLEGSQDYDLALRFIEQIEPENIRHIPAVLYHWRAISGSVALASDEKPYAHQRARQAIDDHFNRTGVAARSVKGYGQLHRTIYDLPENAPLVSIIVAAEPGQFDRLGKMLSATAYEPYELIVSGQGQVKKLGNADEVGCDADSHFSLLNKAAQNASGSVLCFLDASTVVKDRDWLREVAGLAIQPKVGAVGAKIVFPNGRIKHAGFIIGVGRGFDRAHYKFHKDDLGNFMRLHVAQNFSAVSAECLTVRKELFESVGGFDADSFPETLADVDLCLRLRERGFRNVWTPWAEVVQTSEPAEAPNAEMRRLRERWPAYFENDPHYNPNFSNEDANFRLSFPPRRNVESRTTRLLS